MCIRQLSLLLPLTVALLATPVCSTSGTPRRQLRKAQPAVTPNATLVLLANNTFGAKCLDGSPPGYYFRPGAAAGRLRWHIYLPGGAWCVTPADCSARAGTRLGSSKSFPANPAHYAAQLRPPFEGILSGSAQQNPAMYQWNLVRLIYCDGGGYAGTRGALNVSAAPAPPNASAAANSTSPSNSTKSTGSTKSSASTTSAIYLDGWNIIQAVIQDLVQKHEMRSASQILLSGSSAGGQATVNLCDWLASSFPSASTRCLVDSGFFLDTRDRAMNYTFRSLAQNLTALHQPSNPTCPHAARPAQQWRCFFPQYTLHNTSTPLFFFHTPFDYVAAMIGNLLPDNNTYASRCLKEIINSQKNLSSVVRNKAWSGIRWNSSSACSQTERETLLWTAFGLYDQVKILSQERSSMGAFIPFSYVHSAITNSYWNMPWINGTSLSNVFNVWSSIVLQNVSIIVSQ